VRDRLKKIGTILKVSLKKRGQKKLTANLEVWEDRRIFCKWVNSSKNAAGESQQFKRGQWRRLSAKIPEAFSCGGLRRDFTHKYAKEIASSCFCIDGPKTGKYPEIAGQQQSVMVSEKTIVTGNLQPSQSIQAQFGAERSVGSKR